MRLATSLTGESGAPWCGTAYPNECGPGGRAWPSSHWAGWWFPRIPFALLSRRRPPLLLLPLPLWLLLAAVCLLLERERVRRGTVSSETLYPLERSVSLSGDDAGGPAGPVASAPSVG